MSRNPEPEAPETKKKKRKHEPENQSEQSLEEEKPDQKKKKSKGPPEKLAEAQLAEPPDYDLKSRLMKLFKRLPLLERKAAGDAAGELLDQVYKRHKEVVACFTGYDSAAAMHRLSDPSLSTRLVLPTLRKSGVRNAPPMSFAYVGRKKFEELPALVDEENTSDFGGLPGRGKSYLMAAMACYLHTYEYEHGPVVYIQASRLAGNLDYFVNALLLAYVRHPDKQKEILAASAAGSVDDILGFCFKNRPFFIMDEMNALYTIKQTGAPTQEQRAEARSWTSAVERGVFCASYNSQCMPRRNKLAVRLDDPFNLEELACWQKSRGLFDEDPEELLHHTGFVPRILHEYIKGKETDIAFRTERLGEYLSMIKTGEQQLEARKLLNGETARLGDLDAEIFFERPFGNEKAVCVLPYLETKMRVALDRMRDEADLVRDRQLFKTSRKRVQEKLEVDSSFGMLPVASLNGLLAESLTRECILLRNKCLGWEFAKYVVYTEAAGGRIARLSHASNRELKQGICFVPLFFNAKHADLYVVRLSWYEKILHVHAVQISVSAWRGKKRKDSHIKWLREAEVAWARQGCRIECDFTYVLSNGLDQDVSLDKVFKKKFADVNSCLAFIDDFEAPELELQRCKGIKKSKKPCSKVKYQVGDYYCRRHEKQHPPQQ